MAVYFRIVHLSRGGVIEREEKARKCVYCSHSRIIAIHQNSSDLNMTRWTTRKYNSILGGLMVFIYILGHAIQWISKVPTVH